MLDERNRNGAIAESAAIAAFAFSLSSAFGGIRYARRITPPSLRKGYVTERGGGGGPERSCCTTLNWALLLFYPKLVEGSTRLHWCYFWFESATAVAFYFGAVGPGVWN